MSRKLLVINPEQCVEVYFDQQLTIGRDVFNTLCLKDPELSRSHAIIFEQDGEMIIKDLRSRNGVYVRGERIPESLLHAGDEIILGSTVLLFEPAEGLDLHQALSKRGRFLIDKRAGKTPSPTTLREPESAFSVPEMDQALAGVLARPDGAAGFTAGQAMALLQTVVELDASADLAGLFDGALRRVLDTLGGHHGVVMECDSTRQHLKVRSIQSADDSETILIGQPVLKALLTSEKCVFCPDIRRNKRYENMASKCRRPIHSFVAAPIRSGDELYGFIYLDSEDESVSYDFAALRSLYFIAFHVGALLRARSKHFQKSGAGAAAYRPLAP